MRKSIFDEVRKLNIKKGSDIVRQDNKKLFKVNEEEVRDFFEERDYSEYDVPVVGIIIAIIIFGFSFSTLKNFVCGTVSNGEMSLIICEAGSGLPFMFVLLVIPVIIFAFHFFRAV